MPLGLLILLAVSATVLVWVWRSAKPLPPGASANSPAAFAETLAWRDGTLSPNGRRVLWIEPAATTLLSMTSNPEAAAFFARGCPVDPDALRATLPDAAVDEAVSWPLTADEIALVRRGFRPEVMEDKWRIETLAVDGVERVFMLRSWTGKLMYALDLGDRGVTRVWSSSHDAQAAPIARAVLDGYLLGRPCVVPAPREFGDDKSKLMAFGIQIAGRRCKAVEPGVIG